MNKSTCFSVYLLIALLFPLKSKSQVTDIDLNIYRTVQIHKHGWLKT
jgi:hypothetical protein